MKTEKAHGSEPLPARSVFFGTNHPPDHTRAHTHLYGLGEMPGGTNLAGQAPWVAAIAHEDVLIALNTSESDGDVRRSHRERRVADVL